MEQQVVNEMGRSVRGRRRRNEIARELRSHLEESQRELEASGLPYHTARQESIVRFGSTSEVAAGFTEAYRPARGMRIGLAFALAGALILGMFGVGGSLAAANNSQKAPTHVVTPHQSRPHQ